MACLLSPASAGDMLCESQTSSYVSNIQRLLYKIILKLTSGDLRSSTQSIPGSKNTKA
jgi:hypothetical protein